MLTLDDPQVKAACEARDWPMLADWLALDRVPPATPAEVAQLFAGSPPEHADGISQECLSLILVCWGLPEQAEAVRGYLVRRVPAPDGGFWSVEWRDERETRWQSACNTEAAACRDLKRRVLSQPWAEGVRVARHAEVPEEIWAGARLKLAPGEGVESRTNPGPEARRRRLDVADYLRRLHPSAPVIRDRRNRLVIVSQSLTAPELIWPEADGPSTPAPAASGPAHYSSLFVAPAPAP